MKRNWLAMLATAGGLATGMFGQQYPQQSPPYQNDPNYNGQYDNRQSSDGQYAGDPGNGVYDGDPAYDGQQGVYAPALPPTPNYAYQRPPMPGPGYYWVDGYWNFVGGRYAWVGGYWMLPPYASGYWMAPRYSGGHFFAGFWGGGRRDFGRGFVGVAPRYPGRVVAPRQIDPRAGNGGGGQAAGGRGNRIQGGCVARAGVAAIAGSIGGAGCALPLGPRILRRCL